jgi:hypothetical protein
MAAAEEDEEECMYVWKGAWRRRRRRRLGATGRRGKGRRGLYNLNT